MTDKLQSRILISPHTSALLVVDCQSNLDPVLDATIAKDSLTRLQAILDKAAELGIPVVSTVFASKDETPAPLNQIVSHLESLSRRHLNPWEDARLRSKMSDIGRERIIVVGNCAEGAVSFAALGALELGYHAFVVVDAVHAASELDATTAITRMTQAGVVTLTTRQLLLEWGR